MTTRSVTLSKETVAQELVGLKQAQLVKLVVFTLGAGWLFFTKTAFDTRALRVDGIPLVALLAASSISVLELRKHHFQTASVLHIATVVLAMGLIIMEYPVPLPAAVGLIAIVSASMLLGTGAAILTCLLTFVTLAAALWLGTHELAAHSVLLAQALLVFVLVLTVSCISHAPLQTSTEWALSAWDEVHAALLEARERRAAIYRTARSLDEAMYRIERMNNELMIARDAAEAARNAKLRFAATVSHELRGPLNLILGFSQLMVMSPERYGVPLPAPYVEDMDTIYVNCRHLANLVDDVLDLSQVETDKLPLIRRMVSVAEVVGDAAGTLRSLVERKGLSLVIDLMPDAPAILGDPLRLRQVLINLLANAVRFTDRGGITVRLQRKGEYVVLSIQDTGRGIEPEEMPKLFSEFYRIQKEDVSAFKGTGLGLAISRYLVELHGGRIWAESTLGIGTTIHFSLPLPEAEPLPTSTRRTGEQHDVIQQPKVCLVVHPEPQVVHFIARHLNAYHVVGTDEEQIPAIVDHLHPRGIVTVPELVDRVRDQLSQVAHGVPVISCCLLDVGQSGYVKGPVSHLVKPVTPEMVAAAVQPFIGAVDSTILITDDDPDSVRLLESMLTTMPHSIQIMKAYSGRQALALMSQRPPELVLLDLAMPDIDGKQVLATMHNHPELSKVPVITISAHESANQIVGLGLPLNVLGNCRMETSAAMQCLQDLLDALMPEYDSP